MLDKKLLEVENLKTTFSTGEQIVNAVDGVSFSLNRGETLGIVGESGSGKSVTALSIMGLLPVPPAKIENGQIRYFPNQGKEVDLLALTDAERRSYRGKDIAMIFQEPMTSLNPVFRCGPQITEAIQLHLGKTKEEAKALALSLLEKAKLPDPERIFRAYPHELSGGQKQRVMIAIALSCHPQILIADEPTTSLDVTVQKAILDLVNQLKAEFETSVIFISHDLGVIGDIADRVAVMYQGKIVEQGTVKDIFTKPSHPYTQGLLACRPPLDYPMRRLPVIEDFMLNLEEDSEKKASGDSKDMTKMIQSLRLSEPEIQERRESLQEADSILEVKGLQTWFPEQRNFWGKPKSFIKAVDDVSFKMFTGETLGLVGESGCGKTTLGRTILGLTAARAGSVHFSDKDLLKLSPEEWQALRREMQIIFQDPYSSLNPRIRIGRAILEPMKLHGIGENEADRKERVMELLKTVQLSPDHFNRFPHEFSGGQRQRICIARALAVNPRFLICDESVSALDVSVQAQVLNLLVELRSRFKLSYIFISHDLSVVRFIADRILVMNEGKIVERGTPEEIYQYPKEAYTKKLIEAIPRGYR